MTALLVIPLLVATAGTMPAGRTSTPTSDPGTWHSSVDLAKDMPCERWHKNPNGTWTLTGTVNLGGATLTDVAFGGGQEAQILEQRCANGK